MLQLSRVQFKFKGHQAAAVRENMCCFQICSAIYNNNNNLALDK